MTKRNILGSLPFSFPGCLECQQTPRFYFPEGKLWNCEKFCIAAGQALLCITCIYLLRTSKPKLTMNSKLLVMSFFTTWSLPQSLCSKKKLHGVVCYFKNWNSVLWMFILNKGNKTARKEEGEKGRRRSVVFLLNYLECERGRKTCRYFASGARLGESRRGKGKASSGVAENTKPSPDVCLCVHKVCPDVSSPHLSLCHTRLNKTGI